MAEWRGAGSSRAGPWHGRLAIGIIKREGDKLIVVRNEANQKAVSKLLDRMRELLKTDKGH